MASIPDIRPLKGQAAQSRVISTGSLRFDWTAAGLSLLVTSGAFLDGWAHNHGKVDQTFFTPWHAALYGGVFGFFLFLVINQLLNMRRGADWRHALPAGYLLSLAGTFLFLLGGVLDLFWHELVGFEVNLEILLSPTHLFLVASTVFMVSGPLRSAWSRRQPDGLSGWKKLGPVILSLTAVLSILTFITQFAHPFVNPLARSASISNQAQGVTSILLQTALLTGFLLLSSLAWKLPFGAFTLLVLLNAGLMVTQHDHYELLPAALAGGLVADLLVLWLKPSLKRPLRTYLLAFLFPVLFYSLYFWVLQSSGGIGWPLPVWLGSIFMVGGTGGLLSYLVISLMRAGRELESSEG